MALCYHIERIADNLYQIQLPIPGKPNWINCYLVLGRQITLIDTGIHQTKFFLGLALDALALNWCNIDQILLTHGHVDHYGAAQAIRLAAGGHCTINAHKHETQRLSLGYYDSLANMSSFLVSLGLPWTMGPGLLITNLLMRWLGPNCLIDNELSDNQQITIGDYSAFLVHSPGHSKGSSCYFVPETGWLFCGDHLVKSVKPIILAGFEPAGMSPSLDIANCQQLFQQSLQKVIALTPSLYLPGHGDIFDDAQPIVAFYEKTFQQRQKRFLALLRSEKQTVFQLASLAFPVIKNITAKLEMYLALAETYSHLSLLVKENRIILEQVGGTLFYYKNQ